MIVRARLAALAAAVGSFVIALPAQAQTAPVAGTGTENVIPISVWIWILVGTGVATVGFAAVGVSVGNSKR
jgi:hypothetical protein